MAHDPAREARRYLITGGTSGIGSYVASHCAAQGDAVWVVGTDADRVRQAVAAHGLAGGSVCDVSEPETVSAAMSEAKASLGGLDGVFANAGIDGENAPAHDLDPAHFEHVLRVNVVGILATAQAAYRTLERPGSIVVNASVNAIRPEPGFADYNASKAAAASLAQSLALDWASEELTVTCIAPGYFPSRMTNEYLNDPAIAADLLSHLPIGRFGQPAEVAHLVRFLLEGTVPFLTGAVIPIAGGRNI